MSYEKSWKMEAISLRPGIEKWRGKWRGVQSTEIVLERTKWGSTCLHQWKRRLTGDREKAKCFRKTLRQWTILLRGKARRIRIITITIIISIIIVSGVSSKGQNLGPTIVNVIITRPSLFPNYFGGQSGRRCDQEHPMALGTNAQNFCNGSKF